MILRIEAIWPTCFICKKPVDRYEPYVDVGGESIEIVEEQE